MRKKAIISGLNVFHNEEFGGIDVNVRPDEMRHHGFNLGDSLDFVFSNGNELKDVPYFDGFAYFSKLFVRAESTFLHVVYYSVSRLIITICAVRCGFFLFTVLKLMSYQLEILKQESLPIPNKASGSIRNL